MKGEVVKDSNNRKGLHLIGVYKFWYPRGYPLGLLQHVSPEIK